MELSFISVLNQYKKLSPNSKKSIILAFKTRLLRETENKINDLNNLICKYTDFDIRSMFDHYIKGIDKYKRTILENDIVIISSNFRHIHDSIDRAFILFENDEEIDEKKKFDIVKDFVKAETKGLMELSNTLIKLGEVDIELKDTDENLILEYYDVSFPILSKLFKSIEI